MSNESDRSKTSADNDEVKALFATLDQMLCSLLQSVNNHVLNIDGGVLILVPPEGVREARIPLILTTFEAQEVRDILKSILGDGPMHIMDHRNSNKKKLDS